MNVGKSDKSILIVDDTAIYRQIFLKAAEQIPSVGRVEVARSGREAVQMVRKGGFGLVICDLIMPEMDGLLTLNEIQNVRPEQQIVVVSGVSSRDSDITVEALSLGALDFIEKPRGKDMEANLNQLSGAFYRLLRTAALARPQAVKQRSESPKPTTLRAVPKQSVTPRLSSLQTLAVGTPALVLIGVSTGGPNALKQLLPKIPADFPAPIALVQHMPAGFTATLARQLDSECSLTVREAEEGDTLKAGTVYIAPGGKHLELNTTASNDVLACTITDGVPVNSCKPAVDILFGSVAASSYRRSVLSVILTGMGNDGADGVAALKQGKSICLTQSQDSCVVYGMPKAVDDRSLSDEQVPLDSMAERILAWAMPGYKNEKSE